MIVTVDMSDMARLAQRLAQLNRGGGMKRAVASALNRAGDQSATQIGRALAEASGAGVRTARRALTIKRAYAGNLEYTITVPGEHMSLGEFAPRQTKRGVSARPWGTRRVFPHTFEIRGEVFARVGKARLPIRKLWGPSLAREAERNDVAKLAEETVRRVFAERLGHELQRMLLASPFK